MTRKKRKAAQRASARPRFIATAIGSFANMIAVVATSGVLVTGFLLVRKFVV